MKPDMVGDIMEGRNDKELINLYLEGDEKSLEILIKRYLKPIYNFVRRYVGFSPDAEDVVQSIFLKMWKNIKKFDQGKNFKTWLFSIAKNASVDFLRKKRDIPFSRFEDKEGRNIIVDGLKDVFPLPSEVAEHNDISRSLSLALEKIPADYRMVLFLRYNDHFTFREIAESLGESINTIKSRHLRALTALKKIITI